MNLFSLKAPIIIVLIPAVLSVLLYTEFLGGLQWLLLQKIYFLPFFFIFGDMEAFFVLSTDVGFFISIAGQIAGVIFYVTLYMIAARLISWVRLRRRSG